MFLNNQITMNILMKLLISELILGFELDHWWMLQNGGNFFDSIKNWVENWRLLGGDGGFREGGELHFWRD
jgi:hypothetical protein